MNFRGTFDHALDAKHRLTIPARFRAAFADGVVLAPSPATDEGGSKSVAIWTAEAYDGYVAGTLDGMNPASKQYRRLSRILSNSAFDLELDSANRVMIPTKLMDYAGLGKDVTVTGSGRHLEVWDRSGFPDTIDDAMSGFSELTENL